MSSRCACSKVSPTRSCARVDLPVGTVKSRLSRAKRRLAATISPHPASLSRLDEARHDADTLPTVPPGTQYCVQSSSRRLPSLHHLVLLRGTSRIAVASVLAFALAGATTGGAVAATGVLTPPSSVELSMDEMLMVAFPGTEFLGTPLIVSGSGETISSSARARKRCHRSCTPSRMHRCGPRRHRDR